MSEFLGLTVAEFVSLLRDRGKKVPSEVGAFITLQAVEGILDRPAILSPETVRVTDEGAVSVFAPAGQASPSEVTKSASGLLAHLLVGAGAAVPRVLLDLVEHGPSDGSQRLGRFRDELEASLVPLNRGASQRILARLVRETRTGAGTSERSPAVDLDALDADLDALLREPTEAAVVKTAGLDADLDAFLGGSGAAPKAPSSARLGPNTERRTPNTERRTPNAERRTPNTERRTPNADPRAPIPEHRSPNADPRASISEDRSPNADPRASISEDRVPIADPRSSRPSDESRKGLYLALFFVALVAGTATVVGVLRPDVLRRMTGDVPPPVDHRAEDAAALAAAERRAATEVAERYGNLLIHVEPARSQVLLRIGRGPAVAQDLPVGIAHEFVAIAEGRAPTRAVVPPDASWEPTADGPRYELAMQAGDAPMAFEALELGATRLPREGGAHRGQLGSVRVLTNPPGAEVYLLIGFSPDVRVRDLRADRSYEILAWREGYVPQRVTVAPDDFHPGPGGKVAQVNVALDPRSRRQR